MMAIRGNVAPLEPKAAQPQTSGTSALAPELEPLTLEGVVLTGPDEAGALVTLTTPNPVEFFTAPGVITTLLARISSEAMSLTPDLTTDKGRKAIASQAYRVAQTKTYLDGIGKDEVARLKELPTLVDGGRKTLRDGLDAIRDRTRQPLTDWETRQEEQSQCVIYFESLPSQLEYRPPADIAIKIERLRDPLPTSWERFAEIDGIRLATLTKLEALHKAAIQKEEDAKELTRLREAEAQRQAEQAQKEEDARRSKEAEEKAARDAQEAIDRAEREKAAAEQRAKDAEAAAERAKQEAAEREEQARIEATQAEKRRQEAQAKKEKDERDARERDVEHRRAFNREALADITSPIFAHLSEVDTEVAVAAEAIAKEVLKAIVAGQVRHIQISY